MRLHPVVMHLLGLGSAPIVVLLHLRWVLMHLHWLAMVACMCSNTYIYTHPTYHLFDGYKVHQ